MMQRVLLVLSLSLVFFLVLTDAMPSTDLESFQRAMQSVRDSTTEGSRFNQDLFDAISAVVAEQKARGDNKPNLAGWRMNCTSPNHVFTLEQPVVMTCLRKCNETATCHSVAVNMATGRCQLMLENDNCEFESAYIPEEWSIDRGQKLLTEATKHFTQHDDVGYSYEDQHRLYTPYLERGQSTSEGLAACRFLCTAHPRCNALTYNPAASWASSHYCRLLSIPAGHNTTEPSTRNPPEISMHVD
jgi:hypothetical protein